MTRTGGQLIVDCLEANGVERVYIRSLTQHELDPLKRYPFISAEGRKFWLLAIYPEYHSRLLPDSILNNEPREIVEDVSYANTIHKVYISGLALQRMSPGDPVIFYRTSDIPGLARKRSVVTSVCVIEEVRQRRDFADLNAFLTYTKPRSVFTDEELREKYLTRQRLAVDHRRPLGQYGAHDVRTVPPPPSLRRPHPDHRLDAAAGDGRGGRRELVALRPRQERAGAQDCQPLPPSGPRLAELDGRGRPHQGESPPERSEG